MGSNLNFNNSVDDPPAGGAGAVGRPPGALPLTRQASVYSLTFDEFQTTVDGAGKDFGSMNMDELLKSIWSAEDNHNLGSASAGGGGPQGGTGYLQRQGSMILPRTLSQKTVDEVWKDMSKEYDGGGEKDCNGQPSGFGVPHRQPTLGEITLEEFLVRAGVVREEPITTTNNNNNVGIFGDLWHPVTSTNTNVGFGGVPEFSNPISANLPLNVNGVRSGAAENHHFQQQQQILPKQPVSVYGSQMGVRGGMGISNQAMSTHSNGSIAQNASIQGGGLGMVGLGGNNNNNGIGVRNGSPAANYSSDGLTKSNGDTSPVSPVPYVFHGGLRGRRNAAVEKVVERRQRRMIKNRESAAKSRARKQAYTTELEEEVAKLKEEHEELLKKQAEIMEMQKNQVLEMIKQQNGGKRQCLRRTQTGPW